jgi:hypothetical protein
MTNHVLKTAVAVALGTMAGSAFAFNPSVTAPSYEVVFSGATAASNSARFWIIDRVCDTTQAVDVFRRFTGGSFGNDWAVACVTKSHQDIDGDGVVDAGEAVAAKNVLFRKRDTGGSGWGVTPVTHPMDVTLGTVPVYPNPVNAGGTATGFRVDIMAVTAGAGAGFNCDTTANPPVPQVSGGGTNYTEYKCGITNDQKVPDAGFSDIEPNKFFGINSNPAAGLPEYVASSEVLINTFGALVFNTPVTLDLRNALQAVQGLTVGAEDQANMPSLSSAEIRSLFTNGIPTWNNLLVTDPANPAGAKIPLANHPAVIALGTVPADKKVQICRRVNGSGTQAQFNAIMLNWPCDTTVTGPSSEPGLPTGPVVANNSGSSDVSRCLDDFNDGSNTSGKNTGLVKRWAIGINSTENNTNNSFSYRFIKIDGAAPTINAVHAGDYYDYAEQSFQYRTNTDTLLNATNPDPVTRAADKAATLTILAHMAAQGNTPNDTAVINANYVYTWGQGGWLVTPKSTGGFSPSNPFTISNPVNSSTRAPFGKAPNTCHFPTVIKATTTGL